MYLFAEIFSIKKVWQKELEFTRKWNIMLVKISKICVKLLQLLEKINLDFQTMYVDI